MKNLIRIVIFFAVFHVCMTTFAQVPQSNLTIGPKVNSNKSITFNRAGGKPVIRWNEASSVLQFSNNGTTFYNIPAATVNSVVQSETSNYTIQITDDVVLANASGGAFSLTLPTASGNSGKLLHLMKTDQSANAVTIVGSVSGASSPTLTNYLQEVEIISDGTIWNLLGQKHAVPTVSLATASGTGSGGFTGSQFGYLFTISTSAVLSVGDTYTNNGNTYTALNSLSSVSGQVLFMSGAGTLTTGSPLVRSSGSGTSSITFTANQPLYKYTTPTNVSYLDVLLIGGGGGGAGGGGSAAAGTSGGTTVFGTLLCAAGGGQSTGSTGTPSSGGTNLTTSPWGCSTGATIVLNQAGGSGSGGFYSGGTNATGGSGSGGNSCAGGAGGSNGFNGNGFAAIANTGSGGGGGSNVSNVNDISGSGGGAGGCLEFIIPNPSGTYVYSVGAGGSGGSSSTSGGAGGSGKILIKEAP